VRALLNLSYNNGNNASTIVKDEFVIPTIVKFIKQDTSLELRRNAIAAMANFAHEEGWNFHIFLQNLDWIRVKFMESGIIPTLLKLLTMKQDENIPIGVHLLMAIENVSQCNQVAQYVVKEGGLKILIE